MGKNYEWFIRTNLEEHAGKWIVIVDQKVAASGDDLKEILAQAKAKYPGKETVIAKIPTNETLIL